MKSEVKDPPIRADKKCARQGCHQKLPEIAIKNFDPFCSTDCCRQYHHIKFNEVPSPRA